jgi:hypothetical protein
MPTPGYVRLVGGPFHNSFLWTKDWPAHQNISYWSVETERNETTVYELVRDCTPKGAWFSEYRHVERF